MNIYIYKIEIQTYRGIKTKWLPQDRLKKVNDINWNYIYNEITNDKSAMNPQQSSRDSNDTNNTLQRQLSLVLHIWFGILKVK